jgi:hypothetical protein
VDKLLAKVQDEAGMFIKQIAIEAFRRVIDRTPIDTGRLCGNWVPSFDTPAYEVSSRGDITGAATVARMTRAVMSFPMFKSMYMTNSLPYAAVVEYGLYPNPPKSGTKTAGGFSKKAPAGMVRITAEEINGIIADQLEKFK